MRKLATSVAIAAVTLAFAAGPAAQIAVAQTMTPGDTQATPNTAQTAIPEKRNDSLENTAAVDPGIAVQNGHRASRIIGTKVVNESGDKVGKIDDIVISGDDRAIFAVVSVGGFLGVGAKLVAVPYTELKPNGDRSTFMLPGATKKQLESLPEYKYGSGA